MGLTFKGFAPAKTEPLFGPVTVAFEGDGDLWICVGGTRAVLVRRDRVRDLYQQLGSLAWTVEASADAPSATVDPR
jgi:hypothetical protein